MRLILINPHCKGYGKNVADTLRRKKQVLKYTYFIDYLKDKNKNTAIFIDGTKTSFSSVGIKLFIFPFFFSFIELILWMALNKINPFQNKIYFDSNKLGETDILVDSCRSINEKTINFKGIHLVFFTHYFQKPKETAQRLEQVSNTLAVSENDLTTNKFFNYHFPFIKQVYHLPFIFGDRFKPYIDFFKKANKCLAVGTVCPVDANNRDFIDFFKCDVIQPMRKKIFENADKFKDEINSKISVFENFSFMDKSLIKKSFSGRLLLEYCPIILKIVYSNRHKKYFKFDIVKEFNSHQMFVCPEEIIGLPSVNVFEGMAAGCVYLGIDDLMFTNLGLVPGIHYVTYRENDMDDLVNKIRYYQKNPQRLKAIAEKGCLYVRTKLNKKAIADNFWKDLEKISDNFSLTGKVEVVCAFRRK